MPPQNIYALFDRNVPISLVECIADLLKYDPALRLTSEQCLNHRYLLETTPLNNPPGPPTSPQGAACKVSAPQRSGYSDGVSPNPSLRSVAPRSIPPSHSHPNGHPKLHPVPVPRVFPHIPDASSSHRSSFYDSGFHSITRQRSISEVSQAASDYSGDIYSPRSSEAGVAEARRAALVSSPGPSASVYPHASDRADNVSGWVAAEQANRDWDAMDVSPQLETPAEASYPNHQPMDVQTSPIVPEYPARPAHEPEPPSAQSAVHGQGNKFPKFGSLGFGKKHARWGLGMFGHGDKHNTLPPVQENGIPSISTVPSLKRRESSSTDSRSLPEITQTTDMPRAPLNGEDAKQRKKEQERMAKEVQKEAERQRRIRAEKMQKEQARAVMKNNRRLAQAVPPKYSSAIEWLGGAHGNDFMARQPASSGPIRQGQNYGASTLTVNATGGSFKGSTPSPSVSTPQDSDVTRAEWRNYERLPKIRRREYDDDHSMSSDVHSSMSVISFATVDSDPGPGRLRPRQSTYGMNRMTSMSSIRGSSSIEDNRASPGRSSTSLSLEQQLVNEFHLRASVDSSSLSEHGSPQPPPMQMLSLSSPIPWQHSHSDLSSSSTVDNSGLRSPHHISSPLSPPPQPRQPGPLHLGPQSSYGTSAVYGPPSPGLAPKSAINPMFKVVSNISIGVEFALTVYFSRRSLVL